jgi:hypothetical protein
VCVCVCVCVVCVCVCVRARAVCVHVRVHLRLWMGHASGQYFSPFLLLSLALFHLGYQLFDCSLALSFFKRPLRQVLSMHMTLDIGLIKQELSRFQIQTLNHFTWSITRMMAATRGLVRNAEEVTDAGADAHAAVGTDFGVHLKIKEIELSLKNHIHTLGQDDFLTSLHIHKVGLHTFDCMCLRYVCVSGLNHWFHAAF